VRKQINDDDDDCALLL